MQMVGIKTQDYNKCMQEVDLLHDASKLFSEYVVALPFSQCCCKEVVYACLWCAENHISVVSHLFLFFIHFTDTDGTVTLTTLHLYISIATTLLTGCSFLLQKRNDHVLSFCRYTPSLASYEPNLTNSQSVEAWAESRNPHGAQVGYGPISSNPSWRSARDFTEEANAHTCHPCHRVGCCAGRLSGKWLCFQVTHSSSHKCWTSQPWVSFYDTRTQVGAGTAVLCMCLKLHRAHTSDFVPVLEVDVRGKKCRLLEALGFDVATPTAAEGIEALCKRCDVLARAAWTPLLRIAADLAGDLAQS